MIWTKGFWKGLSERAIKTFSQTVAGLLAAGTIGVLEVDWINILSISALTTLASIFTSIGNADFTSGQEDYLE